MTFTVKYKMANQFFFRKIKKVMADFVLSELNKSESGDPAPFPARLRVFITEKKERIEIPLTGTVFVYSSERDAMIAERVNKGVGQKIV